MSISSRASSPYPSSRGTSAIPPTTSPEGSTAASSPPPAIVDNEDEESDEEDVDEEKWEKLEPFLERVTVYAKALKEQMDRVKYTQPTPAPSSRGTRKRARESVSDSRTAKKMRQDMSSDIVSDQEGGESETEQSQSRFTQPVLVTGAKLKDYQLEGVAWMTGLYNNGISGILGVYQHPSVLIHYY